MLAADRQRENGMANTTDQEPGRWDLEWEPVRRAGRPSRFPPSRDAAYSEFPLRALAFALDVVLLTAIFQLVGQVRGLAALWITRDDPAANDGVLVVSGGLILLGLFLLTASAVYFWRVFRATPGQMLFGLFVVQRATGLVLTRGAALARWLVLYAPMAALVAYTSIIDLLFRSTLLQDADPLLVASLAVFLPIAWYIVLGLSVLADRRRGRGLHDRLAGSVVVRRAGPPA